MPNWCYNRVEFIIKEDEDVNKIVKIFESDDPFNQLIPEPDWNSIPNEKGELPVPADIDIFPGLLRWASTGEQDNRWYDWRIENWGTKWSPSSESIDIEHDLDVVTVRFKTPWEPPQRVFEKLEEMDYDVTWHWDIPEETVCGYLGQT